MASYKVVIADDEPHIVSTLSQLVEFAGHRVVGKALTGDQAVCLNQTVLPDILILDIQMPGMDGLEAARRIMQTRPAPIVVCTAYYDEEIVGAMAAAGVYAYVVKPCRLADLLPAMRVAITRFEESRVLLGEVSSLKQSLEDRRCIEQAKGIVMKTRQLGEEEAHKFLQNESQRQSMPLPELARAILLAEKSFSPKVYSSSAR